MQEHLPNSAPACSCWCKCLYYSTLRTTGMRSGWPKMSSSGKASRQLVRLSVQLLTVFLFPRLMSFSATTDGLVFCRYIALFVSSIVCYLGSFILSGFLFHWFNPAGQDCQFNIFLIVSTLFLGLSFAVVSLHPKVPTKI